MTPARDVAKICQGEKLRRRPGVVVLFGEWEACDACNETIPQMLNVDQIPGCRGRK